MIEMGGFTVQLNRKRVKNLNLRIDRAGHVKLSVPLKLPIELVHRFLHEKRDWIEAHRHRLQARAEVASPSFIDGETHYFLGMPYKLALFSGVKHCRLDMPHEQLHIFIKPDSTCAEKKAILQSWYREQMQFRVPELIKKWEVIIGVQVNEWGIKTMKTRWGSCNTVKKRVWLNLNLIQKPLMCLEYVIVHELVHLLEASHNKRFYALMTQFMPEWKTWKNQLG